MTVVLQAAAPLPQPPLGIASNAHSRLHSGWNLTVHVEFLLERRLFELVDVLQRLMLSNGVFEGVGCSALQVLHALHMADRQREVERERERESVCVCV